MENTIAHPSPQTLIPAPGSFGARLATLPARPLLTLGAGLAALVAVAIVLALNGSRGDYKVLFAGLSDKDGGAVIAQLSQMNVPYRHSEGGGAILVPADKVHDVRMKLGLAGLPKSATGGYELLDTPRFGQTQAGENVSIKRATEGELMKTIGSLSAVHSARVMLALPAQNGFFREQQKPSASVQVTLHPGRTLDRAQLAGIVHLVSSSVPDLQPKAVSVVDGSGALLTAQDGSKGEGLDAQQLQYVQQIESGLQKNVVALLEPVLGRENLRATVAAEVDFSETLQVSEEFKPNQGTASAAVKVQQTLESSQPGAGVPSGVPGAQSNQPPREASAPINGGPQALQAAQGGNAGGANTRRESTTNYEVDKTQRTTRNAMGTVKRLSAAVVVNHRVTTDAKGKTTSTALTSDEVEKLTALVQQGVGFNKERGDTVRVINAPFRSEAVPGPEATPVWQQPWLQDLLRTLAAPAALAFVALLIVLTLIRPALKTLLSPPAPAPGSQLNAVVDDPQQLPGAGAAADAGVPLALEAPVVNQRLASARAIAKQHPAAVANMVRTMINSEAAS
jgi:flagellar M-ring protein FliF